MAIARVQAPTYIAESDASVTKAFVNTPTEGNLLIACGRGTTEGSANASIGGWTNATWTTPGTVAKAMGLWYKVAGAAESKSVQLDWTGSVSTWLIIEEWGGFTGVPTLDKIKNVDTDGTSVTARSSGTTATTTVAAELCIAAIGLGSTCSAASWSNSFSLELNVSDKWFLGSLVVAATGTYETTLSWTTARPAGGLIATFMGVSAVTWIPKVIMVD